MLQASDCVKSISFVCNNLLTISIIFECKVIISNTFPVGNSNYSFIDYGTIIMHNVLINIDVKIGKNCIINTNSLLEHEVVVGDHCHISTGVILNGSVQVGNECFIGSGSIVREGVKIGDRSIISAGKVVMKDLPKDSILR